MLPVSSDLDMGDNMLHCDSRREPLAVEIIYRMSIVENVRTSPNRRAKGGLMRQDQVNCRKGRNSKGNILTQSSKSSRTTVGLERHSALTVEKRQLNMWLVKPEVLPISDPRDA